MTKKQQPIEPDVSVLAEPQDYDSVPPPVDRVNLAAKFPVLLESGVLLPDGSFRPGHLEHVKRYYTADPREAWRLFNDEMTYIVVAMPEVLSD